MRIVDIAPQKEASHYSLAGKTPTHYADHSPNPVEADKETSYLRKVYRYYKNKFRQKNLYSVIEQYRRELDIKVLVGVFGGGVPLTFYTNQSPRKASVVFANMDSWFTDVHADMKKMWYTRYYSFNEIMEKADVVDFLSPYILEGVKQRKVNIDEEAIEVAPCSFIDYSKCSVGDKSSFKIAFSARLEPDKNPMMFLEAAKIIRRKYPEVKFHLMGEGSLVHEIKSFIEGNELNDSISFRFHKNPPEVFANTSIFVSLQTGTNYPSQSVLEAMACGNAIIASSVGDTEMFINKDNGVLIPLEINTLVRAIENLITDNEKTRVLGINAREYALKNHTAEKYIEYFSGIVKKAYSMNFN